jgi:hypothetical protein
MFMKVIHFFALKEDLVPMLKLVESKGPLQYVLTGNFPKREFKQIVFDTGLKIPNLGKATADQWIGCDAFLVCEREATINLRTLHGYDGHERICIDQLANPDSVTFTPGGMWNEDVVLNGCVGTASESQTSKALIKRFKGAIKKSFSKVRAFYLGPKALQLLESGKRFTGAVQSPREFDLKAC